MTIRIKWLWAILLGLALSACGGEPTPDVYMAAQKGAEAAVEKFHARYNAGEYEAILDEARDDMREGVPKEDWVALLEGMDTNLGKVLNSEFEAVTTDHTMGVPVLRISFIVEYERSIGRETFQYVGSGDKVLLREFEIEAPVEDSRGR